MNPCPHASNVRTQIDEHRAYCESCEGLVVRDLDGTWRKRAPVEGNDVLEDLRIRFFGGGSR